MTDFRIKEWINVLDGLSIVRDGFCIEKKINKMPLAFAILLYGIITPKERNRQSLSVNLAAYLNAFLSCSVT